ncbi:hypothetical protein SAMN04488009_0609 [Maribacter sedimenticola]|uniref:Uncharacterized protein n=1 Tax=Maribacter sedimenticola TaxID=228956 RepID=A0ABY1SDS8_9FLAO|nr:hypothetical protein SAMN04488009_0609 [Maribacter sedimenticola]
MRWLVLWINKHTFIQLITALVHFGLKPFLLPWLFTSSNFLEINNTYGQATGQYYASTTTVH